mmetsp:Transcript_26284/g.64947  ORF Transcript_26284/g.64947 Transcript_26284/m.64947 type:complete len:276 (-) Transcript_26284:379-1206(-)
MCALLLHFGQLRGEQVSLCRPLQRAQAGLARFVKRVGLREQLGACRRQLFIRRRRQRARPATGAGWACGGGPAGTAGGAWSVGGAGGRVTSTCAGGGCGRRALRGGLGGWRASCGRARARREAGEERDLLNFALLANLAKMLSVCGDERLGSRRSSSYRTRPAAVLHGLLRCWALRWARNARPALGGHIPPEEGGGYCERTTESLRVLEAMMCLGGRARAREAGRARGGTQRRGGCGELHRATESGRKHSPRRDGRALGVRARAVRAAPRGQLQR